ncbi:type II toxin-antitoxin system VapC family toxin [Opitutus terrae]|uniref:PilT protein domain protein n=1 Tax=Opitutus terrae (strain DSM 11246 / JCM 15787 / PB90-1) TaxID=452637 RepID=B1ZZP4_OPITP|nr:type II toxin-antitoxin system VapC family toxin [Opitutus terrae]ACB77230.1 PilT protein domain protein [Opitutus terrae PB90-1]
MWIVDTCVVLDVFEGDPRFGRSSAELLERLLSQGLALSPVTMVELAAAFAGDLEEQKRFLDQAGITYAEPWTPTDTESAHAAWNTYVMAKRQSRTGKRPVADILIGAFAVNRTGLVTRNAADFTRWFPRLKVREP